MGRGKYARIGAVAARGLVALLWGAALPAWSAAPGSATVLLNGARFEVEVVHDASAKREGLSGRERLAPGRGMLFVYRPAQAVSFWMQGMRFPLDILYFDAQRRLVAVHAAVPPCSDAPCAHYPSAGAIGYVLELAAGTARRIGARPGVRLRLVQGGAGAASDSAPDDER